MSLCAWKSRVRYEYKQIQQARATQIKNAWRENWNRSSQAEEEALNRDEIKWISEPVVVTSKAKSKKPTIHLLKECTPLPSMFNWVLTPRSFLAQNESVLLNLPFISHKRGETDENFLKNLIENYGGKVHGKDKFDIMEDEVFLELVETLQYKYTPLLHHRYSPNQIIFEAISAFFSNRASPEQLENKYVQLTRHEEADAAQVPMNSCEHALQTFKKYFCRRCFRYNCDLHREEETIEACTLNKKNSMLRMKTPVEPCGPVCFKLLEILGKDEMQTKSNQNSQDPSNSIDTPTTEYAASSTNIKLEPSNECETVTSQHDWSDDDISIFQILQRIYPNKYCIIAEIMLTKTCQQVYEFAQSETLSVTTEGSSQTRVSSQRRKQQKSQQHWTFYKLRERAQKENSSMKLHNYFPCNHPGKSCNSDCSCIRFRNACEKYCYCSLACSNRFRGCNCVGQCNTKKCPCFAFTRECDADLCRKCGAAEYDISKVECKNVSIQRGLRKHLLLAPSDVAGWGIFLKEAAQRNDFISEYVGEIISQDEADRRGKVYDKQKCSFLFDLNNNFVVDATYQGGKIRFANHSINPNCYAKVMMVLGSHRIGIFAQRDILPGEELFFDYRYGLMEQLKFVGIEREVETI